MAVKRKYHYSTYTHDHELCEANIRCPYEGEGENKPPKEDGRGSPSATFSVNNANGETTTINRSDYDTHKDYRTAYRRELARKYYRENLGKDRAEKRIHNEAEQQRREQLTAQDIPHTRYLHTYQYDLPEGVSVEQYCNNQDGWRRFQPDRPRTGVFARLRKFIKRTLRSGEVFTVVSMDDKALIENEHFNHTPEQPQPSMAIYRDNPDGGFDLLALLFGLFDHGEGANGITTYGK